MSTANLFVPVTVREFRGKQPISIMVEVTVDFEKAAKCLAQKAYDSKRRTASSCFGALTVAWVKS